MLLLAVALKTVRIMNRCWSGVVDVLPRLTAHGWRVEGVGGFSPAHSLQKSLLISRVELAYDLAIVQL